jgi:uncharacterized protein (DUF2384 family)
MSSVSRSTQIGEASRSIREEAEEVFGDFNIAEEWLHTPNRLLGSRTPADAIASGDSAAVEELLNRIDYGIFS